MKMHENITAFILSGGKSSRMGTNKALLEIDGKSLIKRMVELLDRIFSTVVISSNDSGLYEFLDKKIVKDIYPRRGPLGGIHSALNAAKTEKNFFVSCDMPFIDKELINFLCNYKSEKDIILPKADGRIQSLCGIYSKSVLPEVQNLLIESGNSQSNLKGSVYELITRIQPEIIDVTRTNFYHPDLFFNINTPEDYSYAKQILEGDRE